MRTVIVDDEQKGRTTLENFIRKYAPQLELVGQADSVASGVELINREKPDLVFLDVQMPDGTGFDLLGLLEFSGFHLVFCTAFDQYAVKAFRFSAIDYLLKPLDPDTFINAVQKLPAKTAPDLADQLEMLLSHKTEISRIALHSAEGIHLVNIADIVRCESSANYTNFILAANKEILVTRTLKEFDELLTPHGFVRIHKSHLINLAHVQTYLKGEGGWVKMMDGSTVEVSRRKKDRLMSVLGDLH
jgi:two-component system LytT family response regulator